MVRKCRNCKIFPFAGLVRLFHQYLCNRSNLFFCCFGFELHRALPCLLFFLRTKGRQRLTRDKMNAGATHASSGRHRLLFGQNGNAHGRVFATFKQRLPSRLLCYKSTEKAVITLKKKKSIPIDRNCHASPLGFALPKC